MMSTRVMIRLIRAFFLGWAETASLALGGCEWFDDWSNDNGYEHGEKMIRSHGDRC